MTHNEIESFLRQGALLKKPTGECFFWSPAKTDSEAINSITYLPFFGSQLQLVQKLKAPQAWSPGDLRAALQGFLEQPRTLQRSDFGELSRENFEISFRDILSRILRGEIEKAVPALFSSTAKAPALADRAHFIDRLLQTQSPLFVYGFWDEQQGILGASPELLFEKKAHWIETMALAGTRPKYAPERLPLLKDPKELKEHQLVIKDIQDRLSRFGKVRAENTEEVELPKLFHLRTKLVLESSRTSADELVRLLHPTAALGVAPRNYGIQWMQNLPEQKQRHLFGGPILFELGPDEHLCLVAIRNLQWTKTESRIGVGCGLVRESEITREWNELLLKQDMIFQILGLSS
jgi:isochorismate synthase EntC